MATSNEKLFDLIVRRQINLQRMSKTEGEALLRLLNQSDEEIQTLLTEAANKRGWGMGRLKAIRKEITKIREPAMQSLRSRLKDLSTGTSSQEMAFTDTILERTVPVEVSLGKVPAADVRRAVLTTPFGDDQKMQTLGKWVTDLKAADQSRILGVVQAAMVQGHTVPEMTRNMAAALNVTRNQAEALARTAVNHASNTARNAVFEANNDIIRALRWTATLDGRTSPVCRARDGQMKPTEGNKLLPGEDELPGDVSPPAHIRCRSVLVAVLNDETIASQFEGQQRAAVAKEIGQVPGETTYGQWLRSQDRGFVEQVMGPARAKMFLDGSLRMDQFVDRFGQPLTLEELARLS